MISIKTWQKRPDFLRSSNQPDQSNQSNQLAWLTQPYNLSKHFKITVKNYCFILEQENFKNLSPEEITLFKNSDSNSNLNQLNQLNQAFERQITHRDGNKILAWGRVVIPMETYQAYEKSFGSLQDKPIGETLLFNNPEVRRGPFEYAKLTPPLSVLTGCASQACLSREGRDENTLNDKQSQSPCYARRSIFYWRGLPLLVEEIFAPDLPIFLPIKNQSNFSIRSREKLKDYATLIRLHRPIPILLMLWPTLWALWLASHGLPSFKLIIIFALGVFLMRSCGDVLNDLTDRKFDGQVERTKLRPLVTQRISVKEACFLAFLLALLSFGLVLFLNPLSILMACIGAGLALIYPWMKRLTYFPQVFLGFAYNFGILMAFTAVQNKIPALAWYWWILAAIWTVAYDTFYALADIHDDKQTGIKSTAVLWGHLSLNMISGLQLFCLVGAGYLGYLSHFNQIYYLALLLTIPFGIYQRRLVKKSFDKSFKKSQINSQKNTHEKMPILLCIRAFNNNHWIGLLIFLGISAQFL